MLNRRGFLKNLFAGAVATGATSLIKASPATELKKEPFSTPCENPFGKHPPDWVEDALRLAIKERSTHR